MPTDMIFLLTTAARILLGGAFLVAGLRNTRSIDGLTRLMDANGLPFPRLTAQVGVALQIVCGAALAVGVFPAYAAAGLALFMVLATLIAHRFWAYAGPERGAHVNAFITNTALLGAFLLAAGVWV